MGISFLCMAKWTSCSLDRIGEYNTPHVLFMGLQHLYDSPSSLLPASPLVFPSQRQRAFQANTHKKKKKKTSATSTTKLKHLAGERLIFVFTNVTNPMEPHAFLQTDHITMTLHAGIICFQKTIIWPYKHIKHLRNCIALCMANVWVMSVLVSHGHQRSDASFAHLNKLLILAPRISASPHLYLFSEIELLQGNGNHVECCGTSFSHTTTV